MFDKAESGEKLENIELELKAKNGKSVLCSVNSVPTYFDNEFTGAIAILRDITDLKQMEQEILDKSKKLTAKNEELQKKIEEVAKARTYSEGLLSSMADALIVLDMKGKVIDVNDAWLAMMGLKGKEEVVGRTAMQLPSWPTDPVLLKKVHDESIKALEGVGPGLMEIPVIAKGGEKKVLSISSNLVRDAAGNPTMIFAVMRDITKYKEMEEMLRQYSKHLAELVEERTKKLRQAQEELVSKERLATLGQFSGNISHELRNPLGVIDSSVYYLKKKLGGADEKVHEHLERIRFATGSANAIIQSMIDLTRMKAPKLSRLDLKAIIAEVIAASEVPDSVKVVREFAAQEVWVSGDLGQLDMAFKNIIKNAIEAMDDVGVLTVAVRITTDGQAEVSIDDSGVGIAPENLKEIFEPLFSTKAKGMGFGLSITKMAVEKHSGTIEAKSELGKGTTIIVRLPLAR